MVKTALPVASEPTPPTSESAGLPTPFAPWHDWHFATYTDSPCFTDPLPAGSPAPLGGMLMSHAATSCAVATRPRPGPEAGVVGAEAELAQAATNADTPITARVL